MSVVEEAEPEPLPPVSVVPRLPPRLPRPRPAPLVTRVGLVFLIGLTLAAATGYTVWLIGAYYPRFWQANAPDGQFSLAFPGHPHWSTPTTGSGVELTGNLTRWYRGHRQEVYRVQVSQRITSTPYNLSGDEMFALMKATTLAGPAYSAGPAQARIATMPGGYPCADFKRVNVLDGEQTVTAGRVIVVGDRYYILTVTGPHVGERDWRVQRFFDSFRLGGG